MYKYVALAVRK